MDNAANPDEGDLSGSTEDEYGGGNGLPTAGFLALGLLTFWTYTVWKYHQVLSRHIAGRLAHFHVRQSGLSPESRAQLDVLVEQGFSCRTGPRNVSLTLYAASLGLILAEVSSEFLVLRGRISEQAFESFVNLSVGGASVLFCAASLHFMWWVARSMREHEYHELLLARFVRDPKAFRMLRPSTKFTARWNRNQSRVALFLVLTVPMIISPVLAVRQIQEASVIGSGFATTLVGWTGVLRGGATGDRHPSLEPRPPRAEEHRQCARDLPRAARDGPRVCNGLSNKPDIAEFASGARHHTRESGAIVTSR